MNSVAARPEAAALFTHARCLFSVRKTVPCVNSAATSARGSILFCQSDPVVVFFVISIETKNLIYAALPALEVPYRNTLLGAVDRWRHVRGWSLIAMAMGRIDGCALAGAWFWWAGLPAVGVSASPDHDRPPTREEYPNVIGKATPLALPLPLSSLPSVTCQCIMVVMLGPKGLVWCRICTHARTGGRCGAAAVLGGDTGLFGLGRRP